MLHMHVSAWLLLSAAVGISQSSGPEAEEVGLRVSVSMAVGIGVGWGGVAFESGS